MMLCFMWRFTGDIDKERDIFCELEKAIHIVFIGNDTCSCNIHISDKWVDIYRNKWIKKSMIIHTWCTLCTYLHDFKYKINSLFIWLTLFNKSHIVHCIVQTLDQNYLVLIKILLVINLHDRCTSILHFKMFILKQLFSRHVICTSHYTFNPKYEVIIIIS